MGIHSDFTSPGATGFSDIPDLGVSKQYPNWRQNWTDVIQLPPRMFYNALATEMAPNRPSIYVEIKKDLPEGELRIDLYDPERQKLAFLEAEFHGQPNHSVFRLDEIRIEDPDNRRGGIGRGMVNAVMKFCDILGIEKIELRGGREDGPSFWTHLGFKIESTGVLGERFSRAVWENFQALPESTQDAVREQLETALADVTDTTNQDVLNIDPKDVGRRLLANTSPRMFFELDL